MPTKKTPATRKIKTTSTRKISDYQQLVSDVHSYNINYDTRELYLHGVSADEEPGVEYRMATKFVKNMHLLEQQENSPILVHVHSIGGEWSDGMAIFDAVRYSHCPVTMLSHAQASSMSGVVLQAADKRLMTPNCCFMIHHGMIGVHDHSIAVESAVNDNKRLMKVMLRIFAERCIVGPYFQEREFTVNKTITWLDRKIRSKIDWYMDSEEALYYGFVDAIQDSTDIEKLKAKRKWKH